MEIVSYDPFEELESRSSKEKRKDKGKRENAGLGTLDGLRNPEGVEGEIFKKRRRPGEGKSFVLDPLMLFR